MTHANRADGAHLLIDAGHSACLQAWLDCFLACEACAGGNLLHDDILELTHECTRRCLDCGDICGLCVSLIGRRSNLIVAVCALCAAACERCGEECGQHTMAHCVECAAACRACAESCRSMAETTAHAVG